jgi:hypothetical protein
VFEAGPKIDAKKENYMKPGGEVKVNIDLSFIKEF